MSANDPSIFGRNRRRETSTPSRASCSDSSVTCPRWGSISTMKAGGLIERVVSRHHAVDKERSILTFDYIRLFTLNVGQVPRNGLEQVGLGDNSFQASVFVDDRCQANLCLLELLQNLETMWQEGTR